MSQTSKDPALFSRVSSILNRANKSYVKQKEEPSSSSRITHDLSRINYVRTAFAGEFRSRSLFSQSLVSEDDESHAMYDRITDKFYGVPDFNRDLHWANVHLAGCWGSHAYEYNGWDDAERFTYRASHAQEFEFTEDEKIGILSDRMIAAGSSYLDRAPETEEYALCKCVLANKGLHDISALKNFHYLQYLDISNNGVSTLEALDQLPFLMYLDASSNALTEVLDFKAPFNLTFANLSSNDIKAIRDISDFWSLVVLDLSHNDIEGISGLSNLKHLGGLNLSSNWICKIEGLNNLERLQCLDLYNNVINQFESGPDVGFKTMYRLKKVSLAKNMITSLQVIEEARNIRVLDISDNRIVDMSELVYFQDLTNLYELDLRGNPIRSNNRYFDTCVNFCKNLFLLDGEEVPAEMKVLCRKKFRSTLFRPGAQHLLLENINFTNITKSVIPYTEPPRPMIVLVGPPSCLKGLLLDIYCELYPQYVCRGVNHTTRSRSIGEIDGEQYHFVTFETFKEMMRRGLFYCTNEYFGNLYGFAQSELSKVESKKSVILLQSDLSGALLLRARGLRPTLVLTIPKSEEMHRKYLRRKYYCHSLQSGIVEIGFSRNKEYEGLMRLKNYTHRNIVKAVKQMLVDVSRELHEYSDSSVVTNPDIYSTGGTTGRYAGVASDVKQASTKESEYWSHLKIDELRKKNLSFYGSDTRGEKESLKAVSIDEIVQDYFDTNDKTIDPRQASSEFQDFASIKSGMYANPVPNLHKLLADIVATRQTYLEMHRANPGLFTQVLYTDDMDHGLDILRDVLKTCIQTYHLRSPICNMEYPPHKHPLVKKRLNRLNNAMSAQGIVANERKNCPKDQLGFQNVEGKSYSTYEES